MQQKLLKCGGSSKPINLKPKNCGGIFDVDLKVKRLEELESSMQNPDVWNNHEEMQKINKEKSLIEKAVQQYQKITTQVDDTLVLLEMAEDESDESTFGEIKSELEALEASLQDLELKSFLSGESDGNSAYLSINSCCRLSNSCS